LTAAIEVLLFKTPSRSACPGDSQPHTVAVSLAQAFKAVGARAKKDNEQHLQ